jgi:diguanylate cyclase (GGDEF)-like protein
MTARDHPQAVGWRGLVRAASARFASGVIMRLGVARAAKFAGVGALLVLLCMAVIPMVTALRTETAIEGVRGAGGNVLVLNRVTHAVDVQQAILRGDDSHPAQVGRAYERASADTTRLLRGALPGLAGDARLHARVLRLQEDLRQSGRAAARTLGTHSGEPAGLRRRVQAEEAAIRRALDNMDALTLKRADQRAAGLEEAHETTMISTPIAFALGVLLLALMWVVLLEGRRTETTTEAEVALLSRQLSIDSLTELPNDRAFADELDADLADDGAGRVSLVMLDLDDLKQVNDARGHQAGDERLRRVAAAVGDAPGAAYRIGGDEFALRLPGVGAWDGFELAQKVQAKLAVGLKPIGVTAGIAEAAAGDDREALVHHADVALIAAKSSRRGAMVYSAEQELVRADEETEADYRHTQTIATALARAVDAKDSYTRSHCETVSALSALIGEELGLPPERIGPLALAGLLHDVGKIGIGDDILLKPGKLTDDEFETMKSHSTIGHRILMGAALDTKADWVLHHHERPDGRGYPGGLAGDTIPLESRIILVADAFEAIISDRPYRKGRPEPEALAEIERNAGTQFDADCVAALHRVLAGGRLETGDELAAAA